MSLHEPANRKYDGDGQDFSYDIRKLGAEVHH
jgi:hypothetical protein